MKRIILDENLAVRFRTHLAELDVVTVRYQGCCGIQNGDLIRLIDSSFDILITGDKNLRYQQNNSARKIAIIEVPSTRMKALLLVREEILLAIRSISPGGYVKISLPLP
jgi:hypothetical protein